MAEDEKTERELEWELFGMAIEDLEKMIKQKSENRNVPMTKVLIDWLEFSQAQLDPKYENVYHILNRIIYLLDEDFIIDNPDKKD
ncbi:MAG: hypothetical protein O7C70_00780 [Candidatus Dadabacteria bacterium]|jgi:transcription initiation factor IIE alpha subunit|nr:hypothetical protein [Candidatus Dadabacteria bacterium]